MIHPRSATLSPRWVPELQGTPIAAIDKPRVCADPDCGVRLSRYNTKDKYCAGCRAARRNRPWRYREDL